MNERAQPAIEPAAEIVFWRNRSVRLSKRSGQPAGLAAQPVTGPKRSQKSKRPLLSSLCPYCYSINGNALNWLNFDLTNTQTSLRNRFGRNLHPGPGRGHSPLRLCRACHSQDSLTMKNRILNFSKIQAPSQGQPRHHRNGKNFPIHPTLEAAVQRLKITTRTQFEFDVKTYQYVCCDIFGLF